ncbi:MAG: flagellar hook-associated protein FlgK [Alphaproteobacteria bacterium]|nr:flagellar hook-associated protein FlgK [Alphaproteobacteria bacterium]
MSLSTALSIAGTEIGNINAQFSLIGHNIANANTADYAVEDVSQQSVASLGTGLGAREGVVTRSIDSALQAGVFAQNGTVAALQTQQTALQKIDAVVGATGSGTDIGSLLGNLQNAFSTLATDPSVATQQSAVVAAAGALAQQINAVSGAIGDARQSAQNAIASGVQTLNTALATIGTLSKQIMVARAAGQSTADLENQRDAAEDQVSGLVLATFIQQPDGNVLVATAGGLLLPTDGTPLVTSDAAIGAASYAGGGGIPAITLGGTDVTAQLSGGQIGGEITLRDQTLPTLQANLDEFSETLSTRFASQGLTLFTDSSGSVPSGGGMPVQSGYVGYASEIQVNPAVAADPSLVRDGTNTVAGSPTGASAFTPNPAGGPAGFTTLISRVLTYTFGADVQDGVAQPAANVSGLGVTGTLSAGFSTPGDLAGFAAAMTGNEAQTSAAVTSRLDTEQSLQSTLQSKLSASSSVSVDAEMATMIQLQNAYGANARVLSTVQAMWTTLDQAVQ